MIINISLINLITSSFKESIFCSQSCYWLIFLKNVHHIIREVGHILGYHESQMTDVILAIVNYSFKLGSCPSVILYSCELIFCSDEHGNWYFTNVLNRNYGRLNLTISLGVFLFAIVKPLELLCG